MQITSTSNISISMKNSGNLSKYSKLQGSILTNIDEAYAKCRGNMSRGMLQVCPDNTFALQFYLLCEISRITSINYLIIF